MTMIDLKILMVDDEPDVLSVMAKKVAYEGYSVITAVDGEDAWQKIVNDLPDIIVMDINMPKKDGFEVLKDLRENPPSSKWMPVIIVSARNELEDVKKGYDLEADHYITKPCQVLDILKGIKLMASLISQRKSSSDDE